MESHHHPLFLVMHTPFDLDIEAPVNILPEKSSKFLTYTQWDYGWFLQLLAHLDCCSFIHSYNHPPGIC